MRKQIVYYMDPRGFEPVREFIYTLSSDEREKCLEYIGYLEATGEDLRRPIADYLGNKIYELRPKQTGIVYFFMLKDYAILLHAFRKKTNQVPEREIKIAQKMMADFMIRYHRGELLLEDHT